MPISKCIIYNPRRYVSHEVYATAPKDSKLQAMVPCILALKICDLFFSLENI